MAENTAFPSDFPGYLIRSEFNETNDGVGPSNAVENRADISTATPSQICSGRRRGVATATAISAISAVRVCSRSCPAVPAFATIATACHRSVVSIRSIFGVRGSVPTNPTVSTLCRLTCTIWRWERVSQGCNGDPEWNDTGANGGNATREKSEIRGQIWPNVKKASFL
jgi:hypothetical protein